MAHRPHSPPSPRLSGVPRRLRPLPPSPLPLLCPIGSLLSAGRGCQVPQSRGCSIFNPSSSIGARQFRWRPHVSSASFCRRLLLTTYLQGPVTQRTASPEGNTPNQLGLCGVWCRSAGEGERWPVWQEEMQQLQLRCFSNQNF